MPAENPPYGIIAEKFERGEVIPFLGAGVNLGKRNPGADWYKKAPFLPKGAELADYLANKCKFPYEHKYECNDLAKVAAYYVDSSDPGSLRADLHEVFDFDYDPCGIHEYLAAIPQLRLIITTNYDDLLEQAFQKANRSYYLVIYRADDQPYGDRVMCWEYDPKDCNAGFDPKPKDARKLSKFIDLNTTTVIYKMHGTVDRLQNKWDSYVITEDDYADFLTRMARATAVPGLVTEHLHNRHFLFLGYGLGDWTLRVILRQLSDKSDKRGSWAIQFRPSVLEKALWKKRGVNIYDLDIDEFIRELRTHSKL